MQDLHQETAIDPEDCGEQHSLKTLARVVKSQHPERDIKKGVENFIGAVAERNCHATRQQACQRDQSRPRAEKQQESRIFFQNTPPVKLHFILAEILRVQVFEDLRPFILVLLAEFRTLVVQLSGFFQNLCRHKNGGLGA